MSKRKKKKKVEPYTVIRQSVCVCGCKVFKIEGNTRTCVLCREKGRDDLE